MDRTLLGSQGTAKNWFVVTMGTAQPGPLTLVRSYMAIHGLAKMEETTVTQIYHTYLNYVMQRFCYVTLHVINVISRMLHPA
jgi:hypothetical protein